MIMAAIAPGLLAACALSNPAPAQTVAVVTAAVPETVAATPSPARSPAVATDAARETVVAIPAATEPPATETRTPAPLQTGPRTPRGIYAVFDINADLNPPPGTDAQKIRAQLQARLNVLYSSVLDNPAVSGLTIQVAWSRLNPSPPSSPQPYDWSYLDDAFSSAGNWNARNPGKPPKTIQVQVFPGYFTPQWVLDQIPSCDVLFAAPPQTPQSSCGKATFTGFREPRSDLTVLPMPWNAIYKRAFKTFLIALAARYETNPAFVSIDVTGPTAASTEMIEPSNSRTPAQAQFGGISADEMWLRLLAFAYAGQPAYQKSDQAFIDEWDAAIDMFGQIFSGVTLVATTGDGLFNFSNSGFTIPSAFKDDCPVPDMDCAAETTILSHFVDPSVGGANAKATQQSGLNGRIVAGVNLSFRAAKRLSQRTAQFTSPSAQILGGQQFGTGFATGGIAFGCTSPFPPAARDKSAADVVISAVAVADIPQACLAPGVSKADLARYKQYGDVPASDLIPPEQAAYNILRNNFDGTPAASFFGGNTGTAPENYLQIYSADFQYAAAHVNAPAKVVRTDGTSFVISAQDLLNLASQKLLDIGERTR